MSSVHICAAAEVTPATTRMNAIVIFMGRHPFPLAAFNDHSIAPSPKVSRD